MKNKILEILNKLYPGTGIKQSALNEAAAQLISQLKLIPSKDIKELRDGLNKLRLSQVITPYDIKCLTAKLDKIEGNLI